MPYRRIVIDLDAIKKEAMEEARKIVRGLIEEIGVEAFQQIEGRDVAKHKRVETSPGHRESQGH